MLQFELIGFQIITLIIFVEQRLQLKDCGINFVTTLEPVKYYNVLTLSSFIYETFDVIERKFPFRTERT